LWGKLRLLHHSVFGVPTSGNSRSRTVAITPLSPEPGKACRSRDCCSIVDKREVTLLWSQRTNISGQQPSPKKKHVDRKTFLKPHQRTRKPTMFPEIRETHNSMRPPLALCTTGASIGRKGSYLTSSIGSRRITIWKKTQENNLNKEHVPSHQRADVLRHASKAQGHRRQS
jgi:hypothetical protein